MTRALSILVGIAGAGALVWTAAQVDAESTGGYWAQAALLVAAGLAVGLAQLPSLRHDGPIRLAPASVAVGALALVASGWVLIAAQPRFGELESRIEDWSDDIGIGWIVDGLSNYAPVLAFGLGVVLGYAFERRIELAPAAAASLPERPQAEPRPAEPQPAEPVRADQPETERPEEVVVGPRH